MRFVKWTKDYIAGMLAAKSTRAYPFTFYALRVFGGCYVGLLWCRLPPYNNSLKPTLVGDNDTNDGVRRAA